MKTLENKKVIILGGSSGLGLATAQAAAADGAEVIIVSSNQQRIDRALATLPENSRGFAVSLDKEENIKTFFSTIGKFDHLVYTAGENISMSMVDDTDIENGKDFFTIRFWGAFAAIKYGRPHINEGGSINLMSGNFGQRPAAGYSLGATICGAMDAFTKAMAVELAPVRVNNIAAGIIDTNLWGNLSREDKENFFSHLENTLLLQRVGQPMDVADAFVFLMKQEYMTGQSLVIDGGAVLV
ncbi:SDR family oxidoreductase [Chryseobacterium culicis]|jgi:short-subunit dehydrogenase|uniref:NAD(P)-dependent dehydrogenase, short-chain alcohol dehydrogenase family n=1 Tax=Chryseobacterium culicis TaxID=680127 RepID=A0A1H6H420_CHRCI|nr:SDR family oxidoreductase [Chryseobacterium culicis]SEH30449.1 NAD(P)-dependent dehydrogenase, short-chain alcohol dehydrogenase family [Chryseobacterium culicis]